MLSCRTACAVATAGLLFAITSRAGSQGTAGSAASANTPAEFLRQLKGAVDREDRRAVSALIGYPLLVLTRGIEIPVENPAAFLGMYEVVITPAVRCAIVQSAPPTPALNPSRLDSSDAVNIAGSLLRAERIAGSFKLTRLLVPGIEPTSPRPRQTQRLSGSPSGQPQRRAGTLQRADVDSYVITVRQGQMFDARIDGFKGRDAVLRVSRVTSPEPLPNRLQVSPRRWSGAVPDSGDYRLDVVRLAPYCDPPVVYDLTVVVR